MRLSSTQVLVLLLLGGPPLAEAGEPPATGAGAPSPPGDKAEFWMYVVPAKANVLQAAAPRARPIARVNRGTRLRVTQQTNSWFEVEVADTGKTGWMRAADLSDTPPPPSKLSDRQLRRMLIERSISEYPGPCACPYQVDRAGRQCGRRSAHDRAGGYLPYCFERDVPQAGLDDLRETLTSSQASRTR
jgi:hypothetical protein